jgi:hypothetical protein
MGDLAGNHGWPEVPFGPLVGGLHTIVAEEAKQAPAVLLCASAQFGTDGDSNRLQLLDQ